MTLYSEYKAVYENFQLLGYFLIQKLRRCEIEESSNKSFDQLIERVADIHAVHHQNRYNTPPGDKPALVINQSISDFNISLAKRVRYYENYLAYYLVLKGVPRTEVNKCHTLAELINLIDRVDIIKHTNLSLTKATFENDRYTLPAESYGYTISIPYLLYDSDNNNINEGNITLKCDGVLYASITAGQTLNFTPPSISPKVNGEYQPFTLEIEYSGTSHYDAYGPVYADIIIEPGRINLDVEMTNISNNSRYVESHDTGSENDVWQINVTTTSHNNILSNIPITVTANGNNIAQFITDENGRYTFEYAFHQANDYVINFETNYANIDELTNATSTYIISIKYNLLYQASKTYTQYAGRAYTYTVEIRNESDNTINTKYDGQNIICIDGADNIPITINNGQATYTKTMSSAGEYQLQWIFEQNHFATSTTTDITINSNFILPDEISFFLNNTPEIKYCPLGNQTINKKAEVIITSNVTHTESTPLVIDGETQYEQDENNEYILDENDNPIPIMVETTTESNEEVFNSYCYTNNTGVLHRFNTLLSPGEYQVTLTTASDDLNETVHYSYELKIPLALNLIDYEKKSFATYELIIYDTDNADNIVYTLTNNTTGNISNLWVIGTDTSSGVITKTLTLSMSADTAGTNLIQAALNNYTVNQSFVLFNKLFDLLTPTVEVDASQIQIVCYDESIEEIQLENTDVTYVERVFDDVRQQYVFNVDIFNDTVGSKNIKIISDSGEEETYALNVTKKDISTYVNVMIGKSTEDENDDENESDILEVEISQLNTAYITFNIDTDIYSNLSVSYYYQNTNTSTLYDTFTYDTDGGITTSMNEDALTLPNNLSTGLYTFTFTSNGNSRYNTFTKTVQLRILQSTPMLDVYVYSVYDNNDYGTLTLTAEANIPNVSLIAEYKNQAGQPLSNKLITFYYNEAPIADMIDGINSSSVLTDANGKAVLTYTSTENLNANFRVATDNQCSNSIVFNNIRSAILRANSLYTSITDNNDSLIIETKDPSTVYNINDLQGIVVDMNVNNNDDWMNDNFASTNNTTLTEDEIAALNSALVEYVDENGEIKIKLLGDLQ